MGEQMDEGTMRADFEHSFSDGGAWPPAVERSGEGYRLASAQAAWQTWQLAWAAAMRRAHPFVPANAMTPLKRGDLAGDGAPCPNDHDPTCQWPHCNCRSA